MQRGKRNQESSAFFESQQVSPHLKKYTHEELKDPNILKDITRGIHQELTVFLNDRKNSIPIFGYPLLSFDQLNEERNQKLLNDKVLYDQQKHSLWQVLGKSICQSANFGNQLLIKDLLESHDLMMEKQKDLINKFAKGLALNDDQFLQQLKSKRNIKLRPSQKNSKKKRFNFKPMDVLSSISQRHLMV